MRKCEECDKTIFKKSKGNLCFKCLTSKLLDEKFNNWLITGDLGIKVGTTVRGGMRLKMLEHYGNFCSVCNIKPEWNNKVLKLILDHIDGDAANNKEENLRFICPNCDSQLDTFKSKNKNSARSHRKKYTEVV